MPSALHIELFGDWVGAVQRTTSLPRTIRNSVAWGQQKAANKLLRTVKKHILNQDLPSFKRHPKVEPGRYSGSRDLLIDSGTYVAALETWKEGKTMFAGVRAGEMEPGGVEIARAANWQEHGTVHIPARPVWGPSMEELGGYLGINSIVYDVLLAKLVREGWDIEIESIIGR